MKNALLNVIYTDVLVIGAGAAASRAALESERAGADTVMITKRRYGSAGTSTFRVAESAGFSASGFVDPSDNPAVHEQDILEAALGPCSRKLARIVAESAPKQVPFLESLGVVFQRYGEGYLATKGCFASRRRSMKIKGHGEPIVQALKNEIERRGRVKIVEHSMAVRLIVENGQCGGAFVLDTRSGEIVEYRAKAVILGTGGAGCLFAETLNPVDITGDGYALGYLAGAKLVNMEFMQAGLGVIEPAKTIFNAWIWSLCPDIRNTSGEDFIKKYLPDQVTLQDCVAAKDGHYPFSTRDISRYIEIAVKKEGNRGEGIYADLRSVPALSEIDNINLAQMWPITKAWMRKKGADPDITKLRLTCYAHAFNGGLLIDEHAETTISRLLAVGESAGGPHGADRLGGNMFASGQVFGEIAGKYAADLAKQRGFLERQETEAPILPSGNSPSGAQLDACRAKLQQLASRYLLVVRTGEGINRYLRESSALEQELRSAVISSGQEAQKLLELKNLLLTGRLVAEAALKRTESRGSHYREDFPAISSDPEWRKAIVLEKGKCAMEEL